VTTNASGAANAATRAHCGYAPNRNRFFNPKPCLTCGCCLAAPQYHSTMLPERTSTLIVRSVLRTSLISFILTAAFLAADQVFGDLARLSASQLAMTIGYNSCNMVVVHHSLSPDERLAQMPKFRARAACPRVEARGDCSLEQPSAVSILRSTRASSKYFNNYRNPLVSVSARQWRPSRFRPVLVCM